MSFPGRHGVLSGSMALLALAHFRPGPLLLVVVEPMLGTDSMGFGHCRPIRPDAENALVFGLLKVAPATLRAASGPSVIVAAACLLPNAERHDESCVQHTVTRPDGGAGQNSYG